MTHHMLGKCAAFGQHPAAAALRYMGKSPHNRLRYVDHIFNIAIQAFFLAKNDEALALAITKSERSDTSIDDTPLQDSQKEDFSG